MDRKKKNQIKDGISKYIDLAKGRFTDYEVERLQDIVNRRDEYDGRSKTYTKSYRAFDSEDTYRVKETDTYTFHSDEDGIRIEQDFNRNWDDGQTDTEHHTHNTGRAILRFLEKIVKN